MTKKNTYETTIVIRHLGRLSVVDRTRLLQEIDWAVVCYTDGLSAKSRYVGSVKIDPTEEA